MIFNRFPLGTKVYTDQVTRLNAATVVNSPGSIAISWTKPNSKKFVGTMIRVSESGFPSSPTDGRQVYYGTSSAITINGLTPGKSYGIRAFARATNKGGTKEYFNLKTDGAMVSGQSVPSPVTNLRVTPLSGTSLRVTWTPPAGVYTDVIIRYKSGSYPNSPVDGTQAYRATGTSVDVGNLTPGTTYYFRAFVVSGSLYNSNASQQASSSTKVAAGQHVFTSSQVWTVPAGIRTIDVFCVGGGGSGGSYPDGKKGATQTGGIYNGAGGCSGFTSTGRSIAVTPGQALAVTIGAGGGAVTSKFPYYSYDGTFSSRWGAKGNPGGNTSCAGITAAGGAGGIYDGSTGAGNNGAGGRGGSGGGGMYAVGGSDGSNGGIYGNSFYYYSNGFGQGSTTRAFGEPSNTLYAGGGGGCGAAGGAGGGGAGLTGTNGSSAWFPVAGSGVANTGGGGGGITCGGSTNYGDCYQTSGAGGSGLVIIRWPEQ